MPRPKGSNYITKGVSLRKDDDADLIAWLESQTNISDVIKLALYWYAGQFDGNIVMPSSRPASEQRLMEALETTQSQISEQMSQVMDMVSQVLSSIANGVHPVNVTDRQGNQHPVEIDKSMIDNLRQTVFTKGAGNPPPSTSD